MKRKRGLMQLAWARWMKLGQPRVFVLRAVVRRTQADVAVASRLVGGPGSEGKEATWTVLDVFDATGKLIASGAFR